MRRVVAIRPGYLGKLRQVGDEFDVADDIGPATWFAPVATEIKRAPDKTAKPPKLPGSRADDLI